MEIKDKAIGVFDSGMGGLTAVKEIMELLPNENIIYLGDTARVPYGTRSRDTITEYAMQDMDFLKRREVKFMIAACGTVSSVMADELKEHNCVGVIEPSVEAACRLTKNKKIGVIATDTSIRSGSYERLIHKILPEAEVYSKSCPMFVPLVENGYTSRDCLPAILIAREYLEPLKEEGIDTLILGCTHYPLLCGIISDIMGDGVTLISSGAEAAKYAKKYFEENGLLSDRKEKGRIELYCTDSAELFKKNIDSFIHIDGAEVMKKQLFE